MYSKNLRLIKTLVFKVWPLAPLYKLLYKNLFNLKFETGSYFLKSYHFNCNVNANVENQIKLLVIQ